MKSLDNYDILPEAMRAYISNYGFHFNKKACEYAVSMMKSINPNTQKKEKITPLPKEAVDKILQTYGMTLENGKGYDYVYVANMGKADYKKAIPDEQHLAWYIKETIDDPDASDESVFRCWLAKMCGNGELVEWEDLL